MSDNRDDSFFQQKGKSYYKEAFYNNYLSTNIAVYRYLADTFFEGDLNRVVWASQDMMFRRRQEQVSYLMQQGTIDSNKGILDFPFCAFRLNQDGASTDHERTWFNQALNVEGVWLGELGRKVRLTPMTLTYTAFVVVQNDIDLQYITHKMMWDDSNETLLTAYIDTLAEDGTEKTLKNIVVCSTSCHMNPDFTESDWLEKNKIQTLSIDMPCGTWLMGGDRHKYWLTKKVILDFLEGISAPIHIEIPIEETVNYVFSDEGIWGKEG